MIYRKDSWGYDEVRPAAFVGSIVVAVVSFFVVVTWILVDVAEERCKIRWGNSGYRFYPVGEMCMVEISPGRWVPSEVIKIDPK